MATICKFSDLISGAVIAELPLSGVTYSSVLNGVGSFAGTLPTGDDRVRALDWEDALQEARTAIYVERDGVPVWGGILWTIKPSSGSASVTLGGKEFWSYFSRRYITADVSWSNTDQLRVAADLVNTAQAKAHGSIGLIVPIRTSGVLISQKYTADQSVSIDSAFQTLTAAVDGFDFAVDLAYAGTPPLPQKTLTLSYPRRGRIASQTELVFELPGNILGYDFPRDGTLLSTTIYAQGANSGSKMLRSTASSSALLDAGYPLLEQVRPYKTVLDQGTLDGLAAGDAGLYSKPVVPATVTVRADAEPVFGSYVVGDEARFVIQDAQFPGGLDTSFRIVGVSVTAPSAGTREAVSLTLAATGASLLTPVGAPLGSVPSPPTSFSLVLT